MEGINSSGRRFVANKIHEVDVLVDNTVLITCVIFVCKLRQKLLKFSLYL